MSLADRAVFSRSPRRSKERRDSKERRRSKDREGSKERHHSNDKRHSQERNSDQKLDSNGKVEPMDQDGDGQKGNDNVGMLPYLLQSQSLRLKEIC